jgi:hypothetical protein
MAIIEDIAANYPNNEVVGILRGLFEWFTYSDSDTDYNDTQAAIITRATFILKEMRVKACKARNGSKGGRPKTEHRYPNIDISKNRLEDYNAPI